MKDRHLPVAIHHLIKEIEDFLLDNQLSKKVHTWFIKTDYPTL